MFIASLEFDNITPFNDTTVIEFVRDGDNYVVIATNHNVYYKIATRSDEDSAWDVMWYILNKYHSGQQNVAIKKDDPDIAHLRSMERTLGLNKVKLNN